MHKPEETLMLPVLESGESRFHEVTNLFPSMEETEYLHLVADIHAHGLREPIWTYQGKIIDGRHRARACQQLGIEPTFREWDGQGSLTAFVVSLNLERRHLTSSQRAIIALEIERRLAQEAQEKEQARKRVSTLERFPPPPTNSERRKGVAREDKEEDTFLKGNSRRKESSP